MRSTFVSSGRLGRYQPLMTSCRNPLVSAAPCGRARHVPRPDGRSAIGALQAMQYLHRFSRFFRGEAITVLKLVFVPYDH